MNMLKPWQDVSPSDGPRPAPAKVRTQILVPTRDGFVGAGIQHAEDAIIRSVDADHWLPLSRPQFVADCVDELVV